VPVSADGIYLDLEDEYRDLARCLDSVEGDQWQLPTGFKDWNIYDQLCHLCISEETAQRAMVAPEVFRSEAQEQMQRGGPPPDWKRDIIPSYGRFTGPDLLASWRALCGQNLAHLQALPTGTRIPWYGPDMKPASLATARLMETWAHGQGVFDALCLRRGATRRLRHICWLGYKTFAWSFMTHGLAVPQTSVALKLTGPEGECWRWGDENADETLSGSAIEFCWVVAQCRHPDDTALACSGEVGRQWLRIAQCFAGQPAWGPGPGQRPINAPRQEFA